MSRQPPKVSSSEQSHSESYTLHNSSVANVHFEFSSPHSVDKRFEVMQAQLEILIQIFETQQFKTSALKLLSQENKSLCDENARLLARIEALKTVSTPTNDCSSGLVGVSTTSSGA